MSHTSTINSVVFTDVGALQSAIRELQAEGVSCTLLENAVPRAYSTNQEGMGKAPYVIQLRDARYDIGLYMNEDLGGYEARTDFWRGEVENVLGARCEEGGNLGQAKMGKLYQKYAVCATENQAALQGYSSSRHTKEDGTVQLVLVAA